MTQHRQLNSLEDTDALAAHMASELRGGQILALTGPIGAGKTTFVKSLARAYEIKNTVVSPTFTLLQPYELPRVVNGITTLIHIDAYRLDDAAELLTIGVEDFFNDPSCLVIIEWAEKVEKVLEGRSVVWMNFEINNDQREIKIHA